MRNSNCTKSRVFLFRFTLRLVIVRLILAYDAFLKYFSFHFLAFELPFLHLFLVVFQLCLELLQEIWNLLCRDRCVKLQFFKELECLSVVLDRLRTALVFGLVALALFAFRSRRKKEFLITLVFGKQNHGAFW